MGIQKVYNIV